jgi:hypothetical protein
VELLSATTTILKKCWKLICSVSSSTFSSSSFFFLSSFVLHYQQE